MTSHSGTQTILRFHTPGMARTRAARLTATGADLLITPNCNAAIRQLRSTTETKVLWIDSICIDQSPEAVEERNIQVALMGDICKSAARVVVWLGPSNERVERALHQVMDIAIITRSEPVSLANRRLVQGRLLEYIRRLAESELWTTCSGHTC